jgi:hypothetical protein
MSCTIILPLMWRTMLKTVGLATYPMRFYSHPSNNPRNLNKKLFNLVWKNSGIHKSQATQMMMGLIKVLNTTKVLEIFISPEVTLALLHTPHFHTCTNFHYLFNSIQVLLLWSQRFCISHSPNCTNLCSLLQYSYNGAFTLDVKSVLNENLGGKQC